MSYAPLQFTGDGTTASFPVSWPFLKEAHVLVDVDGQVVGHEFTSPSQITFTNPPPANSTVTIQRKTPSDELLAIINGRSVLKSSELNLVYTQLLYIMQEVFAVGEALEGSTIQVAAALGQIQAMLSQVEDLTAQNEAIAAGIAYQYDAIVSVPFNPGTGAAIAIIPAVRSFRLPASAPGSEGHARSPAVTTDFILDIQKNGTVVGTITFAADASSPVFSVASDVDFVAGDRLALVVNAANPGIRNFAITLKLQRTETF